MPMLKLLAAGTVATAVLAAPTATPCPDAITISVQTINGSGCPAGSADVKTAPDRTSFSVRYKDYKAQDGGSAAATDARKNCQLNLLVTVPQGFSYAVSEIEYRGWARLGEGATAEQNALYYFTGNSSTAETHYSINGNDKGYNGPWSNTDTVETLIWAPCQTQTNLNINSDLRVRANDAAEDFTNEISMNRTDASVNTVFHFSWKRC